MPEDFNDTIRFLPNCESFPICICVNTRSCLIGVIQFKGARVIELEMLEHDSDNLRNEIESPNTVRALRRASTGFSETQTARRRDARRTQDGRQTYADETLDER